MSAFITVVDVTASETGSQVQGQQGLSGFLRMLFLGPSLWAVIKVMEPWVYLKANFKVALISQLSLSPSFSQWLQISRVLHKNCLWFLRVHNRRQAIRHHGGISIWLPVPHTTGLGVHSVLGLFALAQFPYQKLHSCVLTGIFLIYVFSLLCVSVYMYLYMMWEVHMPQHVRG